MSEWRPTHVAPTGGLSMWTVPDPSQAPVAELSEGTPVMVSQRQGAWAEVVCSNDFGAWVDGGRLVEVSVHVPAPPTAAPRSRQSLWIALGVVAVAVVVAAIVISSSGGKSKSASSSSGATASQ